MKTVLATLALACVLAGCAFSAPQPPEPSDSPRVPINTTEPLIKGL